MAKGDAGRPAGTNKLRFIAARVHKDPIVIRVFLISMNQTRNRIPKTPLISGKVFSTLLNGTQVGRRLREGNCLAKG